MNLTTATFFLFLAAVLAVYYLLPRRGQNFWLLLASYAFCISWAWPFALALLAATLFNFILARVVGRREDDRPFVLWLGIGVNLLLLILFRVGDFFLPELADLLAQSGWPLSDGLKILIPLGISYYILENIAYLVDVYRGQQVVERDFVEFALYLAYFPKLIAGPIERAQNFLPQLQRARLVDNRQLSRSLGRIFLGLARKIIIADTLAAALPWDLFVAPESFHAVELWGWLFVYAFYLYNDFAGYTAIARGVSGLFGIELSSNFEQPYLARSFTEFWNRWHISLSHWLRDYIYFPLTRALLRRNRNRYHIVNWFGPPLVTMLVSGLWHGLSWHMVLWGGLHGLYQAGERLLAWRRPVVPPQRRPLGVQIGAGLLIFILVSWAWVPFRLELPAVWVFWRQLLTWGDFTLRYRRIVLVLPYLLLVFGFDLLQNKTGADELPFFRWPRLLQGTALAVILLLLLILNQQGGEVPFVYRGF